MPLEKFKEHLQTFYTIGDEKSYDSLMSQRSLFKAKGGSVWKTYEAVLLYLHKVAKGTVNTGGADVPAAIYTVQGNWKTDVDIQGKDYGILNKKLLIKKKI